MTPLLSLSLLACSGFHLEPLIEDAPEGAFMSVWGPDAEDVWIVGGQADAGLVLRGNADAGFSAEELPEGTPLINWVHGTGPDDIWLAGLGGTLLHWDGAGFEDHSEAIDEAFWGVHAVSEDEVYAVGGMSRWGGEAAIARRYDGGAWHEVPLPEGFESENLYKAHSDGQDIWFVGAQGVVLKGRGDAFTPVGSGTAQDLVTAHQADEGPMVIVGGHTTGLIYLAEGDAVRQVAWTTSGLSGVVSLGDHAVVVGERGYVGVLDFETEEVTPGDSVTGDILHGVWGLPGEQVYAVGGNLFTSDDVFHGVVLSGRDR